MNKLLFLCTLALLPNAYGQSISGRIHENNPNGWWNYFGDHPIGDTKWGIHLEGQWRRNNIAANWQQLLLRPAVNYSVHPNITFTAGYGFIATMRYGDNPFPYPFPEHRFFEQVQVTNRVGRVSMAHRYRLEQRELGELNIAPDGTRTHSRWRHENRFRYMYRVMVPIKGKWGVALYDEFFLNFGKNVAKNVFDQNRAYGAITYNLPKKSRLEAGFMEQTLQQRNGIIIENNHTLMVSIYSALPFGHRKD